MYNSREHCQFKSISAVRPEAVERAKKLIAEIRYPGDETIRGIASLLALKIEPTKES